MDWDIHTIGMILGISCLVKLAVFFQFLRSAKYQGILSWIIGSALTSAGLIFINIGDYTTSLLIRVMLTNGLIALGTIFQYLGVRQFFGLKISINFLLPGYLLFISLYGYFTFVQYNFTIRAILIFIFLAIISFQIFITAYRNKLTAIAISTRFFASTLFFQFILFIIGTIFALLNDFENAHDLDFLQTVIMLAILITADLCTLAFIGMLNQRLNSEVRETKERMELFFQTSPDAIVITRLSDGVFVEANTGFTELFGYSISDMLGKTMLDLNFWYKIEERERQMKEVVQNGYVSNFEAVFRCKDGKLITGINSVKVILVNGEKNLLCVIRDISARKAVEENLKLSEKNLNEAQRLGNIGHWEYDILNDKLLLSEQACKIYGVSPNESELSSITLLNYFRAETHQSFFEEYREALKNRTDYDYERSFIRPDGLLKYVKITVSTKFNEDGQPIRVLGSVLDITELKLIELELQKINNELVKQHEKNVELEKINSIHAMVVTANHELNQPLSVLRGRAAILRMLFKNTPLTEQQTSNFVKIDEAINQIEQILKKYRNFESVRFGEYGNDIKMVVFDQQKKQ